MALARSMSTSSSMDEISASYDDVPIIDSSSVPKVEKSRPHQSSPCGTQNYIYSADIGLIKTSKVLYGRRQSVELVVEAQRFQDSRVLILYTGGTIGMVRNDRGNLAPIPRELEQNLRRYPHMHDEVYCNAHYPNVPDSPLVLPDCREKKRIVYWVYEYEPLLDSSNMTMDDWIRIAKDIRGVYDNFDGFVVLHGTDTLAYTASALSFMLENLGKPVIITGSQIPIFETRSDGRDNFVGSVIMAGNYGVPEVSVFFNSKLYRGNRTTKVSTGRLQAFDSPNMSPLAVAGISIQVDNRLVFRQMSLKKFKVFDRLNRNVGLLRIFPSISAETVRAFLQPPLAGAVIQTYGAGNMPSNRKDMIQVLKEASDRGVLLVNITQCMHGAVDTIYETGQAMVDAGVMPGLDMTPEAALSKLSYVLAKKTWDLNFKKKMMVLNLRGEMTDPESAAEMENGELRTPDVATSLARMLHLSTEEDVEAVKDMVLPIVFFKAVRDGDITRLEQMYKNGMQINETDATDWTALHIASKGGLQEVVTWLLEHGASVHARDRQGRTALSLAVENDHHKVIGLLVQTGGHLFEAPTRLGEAIVAAAASSNYKRLTSYLLAGTDLSQQDPCGRTPLHAACTVGSEECVNILLNAGVSTETRDRTDLTPLMCAQINNNSNIVDILNAHEERMSSVGR